MTISPSTLVTTLPGVGPRQAARMEKLGLTTVRDLLFHIPRRYDDTRDITTLDMLEPGRVQTVVGRLLNVHLRRSPYRKMVLVEAHLEGGATPVSAVWFNQPYLAQQLHAGMELLLSGKVERSRLGLTLRNPAFERVGEHQRHVGRLAPVYPETEGLSSRYLRSKIEPILPIVKQLVDPLPPQIRESEQLLPLDDALTRAHFPETTDDIARARERLAFDELFLLQLAARRARRRRSESAGIVVPYDVDIARRFTAQLPFHFTNSQRIAAHEILTDLESTGPMNRLLHGDVGSGKTVVAAMATLMTRQAGYQTVVMAPTEILAQQHYATLRSLLEPHDLSPRLLVGSTKAAARREIVEGLAGGHDGLVVGTHALIEEDVTFANVGLVVVDEQHRFGVAQRQRLRQKGKGIPNFLAMTATPIPRSLALTLYGDIDVSELRELPEGRQPITTSVVTPPHRDDTYAFIRNEIRKGRQAFVICPLIEASDSLGVRSTTEEYERLQREVFPDLRIEMLHGRMSARDKAEHMRRFVEGEVDILVSTSVVEVGVDVPNASAMMIEGAERFGIAQLHQFRGRIGRGKHPSFCFLMQTAEDDEAGSRLDSIARTSSGFELAELDLRLRGAGDVVGLRQHGLPEMRVADLLDLALLERARNAAARWLDADPEITTYPPLNDAMSRYRAVFDLD